MATTLPMGRVGRALARSQYARTGGTGGAGRNHIQRRVDRLTDRATQRAGARGVVPGLGDRYTGLMDRVSGFDAEEAANRSAQAQYRLLLPQIEEGVERHRGEQVGAGRLDTGFRFEDEDRLLTRYQQDLNDRIAANGLAAQGYNLQALGIEGDLISGGMDRAQAAENARRARSGGIWSTLGRIGGAVAGSVLGPAGTAIGERVGRWVGDKFE